MRLKNRKTTMKIILKGIKSRLDGSKRIFCELGERVVEITQWNSKQTTF